ncbi:rhombosortase [Vibrio mexicanus]|uniref:rhombosortase n=1 Tax=Vibrio mexicanus TaxID=1004326 RepID=UPI00063C02CA|nr:rhombosortase [Vibrio mexicanus]
MKLYLVLLTLSLACLGLQFEPLHSLVIWHRDLVANGQWWRIVTGNFTHTNFNHLAMNLAGLWLILSLFKPQTHRWLAVLFTSAFAVGISAEYSQFTTYAGLSGVLHGLFGYFAFKEALSGRKSSYILVLGLLAKIAWEQYSGPSQSIGAMINATVATEAHLVGAATGLFLAALSFYRQRLSSHK